MLTVAVPTLVLWAMDDPALLPGLLDGLPDWIPQLQVQKVEQASHWVVHEHPERVAMELRRFLLLNQ
jgi:pimeloyl-ACP methyl ester carboxylesterase